MSKEEIYKNRLDLYKMALQAWATPFFKQGPTGMKYTCEGLCWYFLYITGRSFNMRLLMPELYEQRAYKGGLFYWPLTGFNPTGRHHRVKALEKAIELYNKTGGDPTKITREAENAIE